ncbi:hypothetical protein ES703_64728 [subsurface metagenome]
MHSLQGKPPFIPFLDKMRLKNPGVPLCGKPSGLNLDVLAVFIREQVLPNRSARSCAPGPELFPRTLKPGCVMGGPVVLLIIVCAIEVTWRPAKIIMGIRSILVPGDFSPLIHRPGSGIPPSSGKSVISRRKYDPRIHPGMGCRIDPEIAVIMSQRSVEKPDFGLEMRPVWIKSDEHFPFHPSHPFLSPDNTGHASILIL